MPFFFFIFNIELPLFKFFFLLKKDKIKKTGKNILKS